MKSHLTNAILTVLIVMQGLNCLAQITRPTAPKVQPAKPIVNTIKQLDSAKSVSQFSKLHFAYKTQSEPDCKKPECFTVQYLTSNWRDITLTPGSENWNEPLVWRRIPPSALYGKFEVSLTPLPQANEILLSGIIDTKGRDSVAFNINYVEPFKSSTRETNQMQTNQKILNNVNQSNARFKIVDKTVYDKINKVPDNRTFFIRIIPLDARKNPLPNISNSVTLTQTWMKLVQTKPNAPTIYDDYTITNVKYVPVHFPNPNFWGCNIVVGYNQSEIEKFPGGKNTAQLFMQKFPIGTTICPKYEKDEGAWYEKAFKGVTGFIEKAVNGASNFYSDTKNFIKNKISTSICSIAPSEVKSECESVAGYAFDGAMVAAGIPPSLPNMDDLTKMAEGQIVDIACDKLEKETGVPVPDVVKDKIKEEFHQQVKASSDSRMVDCGFLKVKPHSEGFFKTAYLEIEVTRTGNKYKNKAIAGIGIEDVCDRNDIYCENCYPMGNKNLRFNLFERTYTEVPFLPNVGDKTTVMVVLKPQESWIHDNPKTGKIEKVGKDYSINKFTTPVEPTYEGAANSPGFNTLCNKSTITFGFGGIKVAQGVNRTFYHP
jgi:hypothetical protein